MLLYAAGSIGSGAFYAFNNFVLPPVLQSLGAPDLLIGLLSSTRSIEGALIQPAVGALSDRLWTPLGRRRPFIVVGAPLSALFFVAAGQVSDLPRMAIGIVLFSFFFNLAVDPYTALLADIAPREQRGTLSGLATAIQLASSVGILLVIFFGTADGGGVPTWTYGLVAGLLLASFGLTVIGVREPAPGAAPARMRPGFDWRDSLQALGRERQAVRYLVAIFVYYFGLNAVVPYLVLFVVTEIHQTQQVAFGLSAGLLLVTAVGALLFGRLADRLGGRVVLALGWGLLAISALGGLLITTLPETIVVVLVAGLGNGAATAVSWPVLTMLVSPARLGVFAGLKAAAESIAIPLSIVVAAEVFLPTFGYRGIFAMLAVTICLALMLLLRYVRVPSGRDHLSPAIELD
jgi:maltose/moltooligosaccharide transporter